MTATLTQAGINFNDGTSITKREWIFAAGTDFTFWASSAPTGWTKSTSYDDYALRVVSGTGGGSNGTQPFTTVCSSSFAYEGTLQTNISTGGHKLSEPQIPSHPHAQPGMYKLSPNPALSNPAGQFTGWADGDIKRSPGFARGTGSINDINAGGNSPHSHPVSASGPVDTTFNLGVYYLDLIVCSFDG